MSYGIFGTGRIGRVHGNILLSQGKKIVALGDQAPECAWEAATSLGLKNKFEVFAEAKVMAEAAERLGIRYVVIASHTHRHASDALPFIKAGVRVYIEKPLTAGLADAFDFCEAVADYDGRRVQMGLQRRFDEALLYARSLVPEIGVLREIRCVLRDQHPPPSFHTSRGLIIDMGIHVTDEALWFLGEEDFPVEVTAQIFNAKSYLGLDEGVNTAFVTFRTLKGVIGRLDLSRTHTSGYNNEVQLIGSKGTLSVGRFTGYPGPIPVELWKEEGTLDPKSRVFEMTYLTRPFPEFLPRFKKAYEEAHRAFLETAEQSKRFRVNERHSLDAQVFTEAAHVSAANQGRRVVLKRSKDLAEYRQLCRELLDAPQ